MNIGNEIKNSFKRSDNLAKLIYVNLAVFVIAGLVSIVLGLFNIENADYLSYLKMPASLPLFFSRFWTIFTYMFLHAGFIHIIFNVIFLFWSGRFFLAYFNEKQLVGLYLIGGIAGGIFYLLFYNIFPFFENLKENSHLLGASASVLAILAASATTAPRAEINIPFVGNIKLIYIATVLIIIDLLSIAPLDKNEYIAHLNDSANFNFGGHIAHLGGAFTGCLFAVMIKNGKDLTAPLNKILDFFVNNLKSKSQEKKPKFTYTYGKNIDYEYNLRKKQENEEIDAILDKIKKSGYDNLTAAEKKRLFEQSQK